MVLAAPIVHHIPVCPFSQRLEILLELKGRRQAVDSRVVDITRPRPPELLRRTRGRTALPVLETPEGGLLRESLVILLYLDERFPEAPVAQRDPYRRAVKGMLTLLPREPRYDRVRVWREACLAHPAVGQVVPEEIVRLYDDYALGVGNGALPPGRTVSTFAPQPAWSSRPWPPADKHGHRASDAELGLIAHA